MSNLNRGPSIDASYQASVHLTKQFQRRRFGNQPIRNEDLPVAAMFVNGSGRNENSLQRTFHRCFIPSFGSFGQTVSEEKIFFQKSTIRDKNCLRRPCLLTDRDKMSTLNRGPSIDTSYQASVHLAKQFQRRRLFGNQPIRNKICLWWPCL